MCFRVNFYVYLFTTAFLVFIIIILLAIILLSFTDINRYLIAYSYVINYYLLHL